MTERRPGFVWGCLPNLYVQSCICCTLVYITCKQSSRTDTLQELIREICAQALTYLLGPLQFLRRYHRQSRSASAKRNVHYYSIRGLVDSTSSVNGRGIAEWR